VAWPFHQPQKLEAVGQLAGGVAHDFNNILAATMVNLDLLQMNEHLDPETRAGLTELKRYAERAAGLTRQLLMFSRRSVLETKVLDLNEVVDNLLRMLGRLLGEHIKLVFERSSNLPAVQADAGMLEQVLVNLTVNARDAMPKGGRITISTSTAEFSEAEAAEEPRGKAAPTGSETLLVVEDEDGMRRILVLALQGLGYRVVEAANGPEALAVWRDRGREIDLLLTDMVMPEGMTGLELAEKIRAEKPDVRVIISSGYTAEITDAAALATAGLVYLPKPYQTPLLARVVRQCLDRR
jgi:CheY-like chemotaxis protein